LEKMQRVDVLEADERGWKESAKHPLKAIAGQTLEMLGQRIATVGLGLKDARPIRAWAAGEPVRGNNEARLRLLFRVARTIQLVYDEETARAFLRSSSPYLGDRSPLLAIAGDDEAGVLQAMRAFLET
jgi:hypothetical protein